MTPREKLRETLERNRREMALWPKWMRVAARMSPVFDVPELRGRPLRDEMSTARAEIVKVARKMAKKPSNVQHVQELWADLAEMLDY